MKKFAVWAMVLAAGAAFAQEAYTLVNDDAGYSYIQINSDLDSFSFKSDFKSVGNSGKVGFYVYPETLTGDALKDYISAYPATDAKFAKHIDGGTINLGGLKAGDRVGFYLDRKNGDIVRSWNFADKHGTTYIEFNKNGIGSSKDEWISMADIKATVATPHISGQPLPGLMAVLLLAGGVMGAGSVRRRRRQA